MSLRRDYEALLLEPCPKGKVAENVLSQKRCRPTSGAVVSYPTVLEVGGGGRRKEGREGERGREGGRERGREGGRGGRDQEETEYERGNS